VYDASLFLKNAGVLWKEVSLLSALFVPKENATLRYLNLMFNNIGTSGTELIARALHVSICLGGLDNGI